MTFVDNDNNNNKCGNYKLDHTLKPKPHCSWLTEPNMVNK